MFPHGITFCFSYSDICTLCVALLYLYEVGLPNESSTCNVLFLGDFLKLYAAIFHNEPNVL